MNNKVWYVIGLIIIIGIIVFMTSKDSETMPAGQEGNVSGSASSFTTKGEKSSLKALLARAGSHKCTFTDTAEGTETSGTVYLSDGKLRGDFSSMSEGKTVMSHVLADGSGATQVWMDDFPQGFKMNMNEMEAQAAESGAVDFNKELDYSCETWTVDANAFTAPAGMTFMDMNAMMQGGTPVPATR